ncbi:MAG: hypothetical protein A2Y77_06625 [Planctomycetes bacterium RBG_13_62_9]|nr:MAG: hypothetical protein A2Y77_06625 [Planctomycetes bacterium RBG_13_62_9]
MDTVEHQATKSRLRQCNGDQLCPECGAIMTEADRLIEGPNVFVWYICSRMGCDGQWLRKFVKEPQNV